MNRNRAQFRSRRRRGTILIVTMVLCFTLASIVLVMCRSMAVEAVAASNSAAAVQADAIERGAEQYVIGLLTTNSGTVTLGLDESYFSGVQLGDGAFWIVRPDYQDDSLPAFGLVDECSKIDLNKTQTTSGLLQYLPNMDADTADAIADWRLNTGTTESYYQSLPEPYHCKGADFETVDELLMVQDMSRADLYGDGTAAPLGTQSVLSGGSSTLNAALPRGFYDCFTTHGTAAPAATPATSLKINFNTAPRVVLSCLGIGTAGVDAIVSHRTSAGTFGGGGTGWAGALGLPPAVSSMACYDSACYSADIVAVSGNGRSFKRVKIVVDTTTTPMQLVYRRDFTSQGWPMDPQILADIRAGNISRYIGGGSGIAGSAAGGGGSHF